MATPSNEYRDYRGLNIDDRGFAAPIYAYLFANERGKEFGVIWSRQCPESVVTISFNPPGLRARLHRLTCPSLESRKQRPFWDSSRINRMPMESSRSSGE